MGTDTNEEKHHDDIEALVNQVFDESPDAREALRRILQEQKREYEQLTEENELLKEKNKIYQETGKKFAEQVNNTGVGFFETTLDGKILFTTDAIPAMFSYTANEFLEENIASHYKNPEAREKFLNDLKRYGVVKNYDAELVKKDGSSFWGLIHAEIITNGYEKEKTRIRGTITDITEKKNTEIELKAAKEYAEKINLELKTAKENAEKTGELIKKLYATSGHELRTPLNSIIGFSDLITDENQNPPLEEILNYARIINKNGNALLSQLDTLLNFTRMQSEKNKLVESDYNLRDEIKDIGLNAEGTYRDKNIEIKYSIDPKIPDVIHGDIEKTKMVITNLITNAYKYTKEGEIKVGVNLNEENKTLDFYVKDTGAGIHEKNLNSIFDLYTRLEKDERKGIQGSGIGLAIVKQAVNLMEGEVKVESEVGKGSRFSFSIPYQPAGYNPK